MPEALKNEDEQMSMKRGNGKGVIMLSSMIVISIGISLLAVAKSAIVADIFGASAELDSYTLANSVASFLPSLISSAIPTVVIPYYATKKRSRDMDSFITLIFCVVAGITALLIFVRCPLFSLVSQKSDYYVSTTSLLFAILAVANLLFSLTYVTTGYFQCVERYNIPKLINLLSQIVVVGAICVWKAVTITQYVLILVIGLMTNLAADVAVAVKLGWRYVPSFSFLNEEVKRLIKLFLPIVFSTGVYRISLLVDSMITSRLEDGQLSILGYATQIAGMVSTTVVGNLLIYCYPRIIKNIKEVNSQEAFWEQNSLLHLIVCLLIAGFVTIGIDGISLLFEHGKFDATATKSVYMCTMIYIAGQQTNIVRDLIYRYFYACGDTKTPASNSVLVSITNIALSLILVRYLGVYGVAVGTIMASAVSLVRILFQFKKKIGLKVNRRQLLFSYGKNILIALLTIGVVCFVKRLIPISSDAICILVYGLGTVGVFLTFTFFLKREALNAIKRL